MPISVSAKEQEEPINIYSEIQLIEEVLQENHTDVRSELEKAIDRLSADLENESDIEMKNKLIALISETQDLLDNYSNYYNVYSLNNSNEESYKLIVTAVCAYFNMQEYYLSYELLAHMEMNNTLNSSYVPYYGYRVNSYPVTANLRLKFNTSGSAEFPNEGTTIQKDLYYSIHNFNYSMTSAGLRITDRYDFDGDLIYVEFADLAVDTMARLQEVGYLTPYYVYINV